VYVTPTSAVSGTVQVNDTAASTVMVSVAAPVTGLAELSIADTEKEKEVPAVVGVPVIPTVVAVAPVKFKPGGSEPTIENV
jgi:hypothetical protein